jgi:hypothetical protein
MNNMQWSWFWELPPGKHYSSRKWKHISRHGMNEYNQTRIQQTKHISTTMLGSKELIAPYFDKVYTLQTDGGVYNVSIFKELSCTCPNWNLMEPHDLHHRLFPCKHLYYIYNTHLHCNKKHCIHQGTLVVTEVDKILNRHSIPSNL